MWLSLPAGRNNNFIFIGDAVNEKEIEHQIKRYETVRDCAEERLNELNIQLRDLCEAEKPKLRHGDFGLWKTQPMYESRPSIYVNSSAINDTVLYAESQYCSNASKEDGREMIILGNVFDLMKGWSEDLTCFEFDVHHCEINTVDFPHAPIHIAGNWHTLAEAEEIWRKLGQLIATFKRL